MNELSTNVNKLTSLLKQSNYTVVLTGTGISDETGMANFRNPGGNMWTMLDPDAFTIQRFKENPDAFYEIGAPFFDMLEEAEPGEAHNVLAELERRGLIKTIITKNTDGLHQKAGAKNVLEIYGTLTSASCVECKLQLDIEDIADDIKKGIPPTCPDCGKPLKPDVVLFGEPLPPDFHLAEEEINRADLVIAIGTNIVTSPVRELLDKNKNLVIINRSSTEYDNRAKIVIIEDPNKTVKMLLGELDKLT